jgi:hypothetical protein
LAPSTLPILEELPGAGQSLGIPLAVQESMQLLFVMPLEGLVGKYDNSINDVATVINVITSHRRDDQVNGEKREKRKVPTRKKYLQPAKITKQKKIVTTKITYKEN